MRQLGYDRVMEVELYVYFFSLLDSILFSLKDAFCYWFQIIVFQFGLGANAHYVILELYAQGNIILTDSEYMIMTLLRSHRLLFQFLPLKPSALNVAFVVNCLIAILVEMTIRVLLSCLATVIL